MKDAGKAFGRRRFLKGAATAGIACALLIPSCAEKRTVSVTGSDISIIPMPLKLVRNGDSFTVDEDTAILVPPGDAEALSTAGHLAEIFARGGMALDIRENGGRAGNAITLVPDASLDGGEAGGYRLSVGGDGILIEAADHDGLFHGVQTLRQLLPVEFEAGSGEIGAVTLPGLTVADEPRFAWRGMHLDVSRHFFPKEFVKRYIDLIAMHKMNVFHWHLVDGAGWRIEIDRYPRLTETGAWRRDFRGGEWSFTKVREAGSGDERYGGFYTQDDIREIVAYAAERRVTVVPEIEMPGHSNAARAAHPELLCENVQTTSLEYGNSGVFCAGREETFTFLEGVLVEVLELFPGEYIHIGGDEVPKTHWKACPLCQKRIADEGLAGEDELQSWFIRRIESWLTERGRKLVGWDEILEGGLAPEATVMSWRGMEGGIEAARQGHDVIMAPETYTYFNHYQGDPALEPKAWGGFTPLNEVYCFDPVPDELNGVEAGHVIGAQGCVWTEFIQTCDMVEYMVLPRMSALAEVAWTDPGIRSFETFKTRMIRQYERFAARGYRFARSAFNVRYDVAVDSVTFDATVAMKTDAAGVDVRYTLDGSEPAPSSTLYTAPVSLEETATVRAASFRGNTRAGATTSTDYTRHLATGKKPVLEHPYNGQYPGSGPYTLTDGLTGSLDYSDGRWQAYLKSDLAATIDLGGPVSLSRVRATFIHNPGVWIFMPAGVTVSVSEDGTTFREAAAMKNDMSRETPGPLVKEFELAFGPVTARYVRVRAENIGVIPSWHAGAGYAAFMFADEIVVE